MALLAFSGARTSLIVSVEGPTPPMELLQALTSAVEEHGAELVAERADAAERVCGVGLGKDLVVWGVLRFEAQAWNRGGGEGHVRLVTLV